MTIFLMLSISSVNTYFTNLNNQKKYIEQSEFNYVTYSNRLLDIDFSLYFLNNISVESSYHVFDDMNDSVINAEIYMQISERTYSIRRLTDEEAIVSKNICNKYNLKEGDYIYFRSSDLLDTIKFKIISVCDSTNGFYKIDYRINKGIIILGENSIVKNDRSYLYACFSKESTLMQFVDDPFSLDVPIVDLSDELKKNDSKIMIVVGVVMITSIMLFLLSFCSIALINKEKNKKLIILGLSTYHVNRQLIKAEMILAAVSYLISIILICICNINILLICISCIIHLLFGSLLYVTCYLGGNNEHKNQ